MNFTIRLSKQILNSQYKEGASDVTVNRETPITLSFSNIVDKLSQMQTLPKQAYSFHCNGFQFIRTDSFNKLVLFITGKSFAFSSTLAFAFGQIGFTKWWFAKSI